MNRGKRSIAVDIKRPLGVGLVLSLCEAADALFEPFRPGVAERLGIGPVECMARNPSLLYGRLTGWGQDGPLAGRAGHDIDYIAVAGALEPIGRAGQPPTPPLNVLGDFAGGGMLLAFGLACAAFERARTGQGQVIDAAMVDGAALLMTPFYAARQSGSFGERGTNLLDTGAPFYEVYATADGRWLAVGAIEPQFQAALLAGLALEPGSIDLWDQAAWPVTKERLAAVIATRTRDQWVATFDGTDACVAPVLDPIEAPAFHHNVARGTFLDVDGVPQPAPAPRFSRTPAVVGGRPTHAGDDTDAVLPDWGIPVTQMGEARAAGALL